MQPQALTPKPNGRPSKDSAGAKELSINTMRLGHLYREHLAGPNDVAIGNHCHCHVRWRSWNIPTKWSLQNHQLEVYRLTYHVSGSTHPVSLSLLLFGMLTMLTTQCPRDDLRRKPGADAGLSQNCPCSWQGKLRTEHETGTPSSDRLLVLNNMDSKWPYRLEEKPIWSFEAVPPKANRRIRIGGFFWGKVLF